MLRNKTSLDCGLLEAAVHFGLPLRTNADSNPQKAYPVHLFAELGRKSKRMAQLLLRFLVWTCLSAKPLHLSFLLLHGVNACQPASQCKVDVGQPTVLSGQV